MWGVLDKPQIENKIDNQKKEIITVHKHHTKEFYKDYVYYEKREIFIGTTKSQNLVAYTNNCMKLIMNYKDTS